MLPAAGLPAWAARFRGRWWAAVLPVSIVVVIVAVSSCRRRPTSLAWIALIGVPIGVRARPRLGRAGSRLHWRSWPRRSWSRPGSSRTPGSASSPPRSGRRFGDHPRPADGRGHAARLAQGWCLRPRPRRRDPGLLRQPRESRIRCSWRRPPAPTSRSSSRPGSGRCRSATETSSSPASSGASSRPRVAPGSRWAAAGAATLILSLAWDQLFLVYDELPATIPPALALLFVELLGRRLDRRDQRYESGGGRYCPGVREGQPRCVNERSLGVCLGVRLGQSEGHVAGAKSSC